MSSNSVDTSNHSLRGFKSNKLSAVDDLLGRGLLFNISNRGSGNFNFNTSQFGDGENVDGRRVFLVFNVDSL